MICSKCGNSLGDGIESIRGLCFCCLYPCRRTRTQIPLPMYEEYFEHWVSPMMNGVYRSASLHERLCDGFRMLASSEDYD